MNLVSFIAGCVSVILTLVTVFGGAGSMTFAYIGLVVAIIGLICGILACKADKKKGLPGTIVSAIGLVATLFVVISFVLM